jgi:hypothetical protein
MDMNTLAEFTAQVTETLGIDESVDREAATQAVLDLARDVAHGVTRPAAPVVAYLVGVAAGRADDPVAALPDLARRVAALAEQWEGDESPGS